MYVELNKFTGAIGKISDLVSGDKQIPGVLLRLSKDDVDPTSGLLQICYADIRKAFVQEIPAQLEDTDFIGDVATTYEQLSSCIASCQPYGKVEVDTLRIEYFPETLKISVEQYVSCPDETGEGTVRSKMGIKYIDISRIEPANDVKAKILLRGRYEDIFNCEKPDEYDKAEFTDLLSRTSTEKGKLIYVASTLQEMLVANQAYAVACRIPGYELGEDEKLAIREELKKQGIEDEEAFNNICKEKTDRVHHSFVIFQQMAKALIGILDKMSSDTIYIERVDTFCNIFVDNDDEKVGIRFEIPKGSTVHIRYVQTFSSLEYKTYQMTFLKDLLEGAIKQALATTKSEQVELKFEAVSEEEDTSTPEEENTENTENTADTADTENTESTENKRMIYYMVIEGGSASASTSNLSRIRIDDIADAAKDLCDRTLTVSLKVLMDMISHVKSDTVAFDVEVSDDGSIKVRIADIDREVRIEQYKLIRADLDDKTPTPIERVLDIREKTLGVRQFTMLSK